MNWLRYGWPRRRVIAFTDGLAKDSWLRDKLLTWLYPSDCMVRFK
jgi:hypothetical protein